MKLKNWLFGAAALAMLAACSDRDSAPGSEDEKDLGSPVSGYLAVEIKLPQETVTRGANDVFDDGTANEYAVDNAMIVLFKGKDEKTAKFYKAQDLTKPFLSNMPTNDNITSSYIAAVQVSKNTTDETFWGLAILNRNESSTAVIEPDEEGNETVKIGGVTFSTSSTFQDVLNAMTENSFLLTSGTTPDQKTYSRFFMTNAPLSNKQGGGSDGSGFSANDFKIQYLTNLGNTTYATIEEAKDNIKSCIYVERGVAKVTCTPSANAFQLDVVDGEGNSVDGLKVTGTVRYGLTNTNKKSYVVRNVEFPDKHFKWDLKNAGKYRMIGEVSMPKLKIPYHDEDKSLYRTYWCVDPNYEKNMTSDKYVITDPAELTATGKPLYCKENTFTVQYQNHGNTTLALFQINFSVTNADGSVYGDGNLYTKGGDQTKIYASAQAAAAQEITRIKNDNQIIDALSAAATASGQSSIANATQYLDIKTEVVENQLMITSISLKPEGGFNAAGVAKFNEFIGDAKTSGTIQYELLGSINMINDITCFTGGISYYLVPIKHFGDELCPWPETTGTTTEAVYNGNKAFNHQNEDNEHARLYLGRYGMVRNNWYDLVLNSVTALADPTIPDIDLDLSDDNKEEKSYIGVEIHILSWAKRTQSVIF